MASKYQVLCQAVSRKSFTEAAKVLHHSQSAVSQAVKAVEQEVGLTLVLRKKDDIELTSDGKKVYPYIQNICDAEMALAHKTFEMEQLQGSIVRIGTFPTVSREALPTLMKQFKAEHPSVRFVLYQGEYTSIASMLQSGKVEIGFSHLGFCEEFEAVSLFRDPLAAVLPPEHSLAK
ncbi:LysR family transcriptional regulator [Hominicoprocola fusiformis]